MGKGFNGGITQWVSSILMLGHMCHGHLQVSTHDLQLATGTNETFDVIFKCNEKELKEETWDKERFANESLLQIHPCWKLNSSTEVSLTFTADYQNIIRSPTCLLLDRDLLTNSSRQTVVVIGENAGRITIEGNLFPEICSTRDTFVRIRVVNSLPLTYVSAVVGWIYFMVWSVAFYPQILLNWRIKSVIGLDFNYQAITTLGHFSYAVFNAGLYWFQEVQDVYFSRHPQGVNPVQMNDVAFALHSLVATFVIVGQCIIYQSLEQHISRVTHGILFLTTLSTVVLIILCPLHFVAWLDFMYFFSYIKLSASFIKQAPQAYWIYKRKSTEGRSISSVMLDCTGGILSVLQMFIISYNSNDWGSIFGDFSKFGLGAISLCFSFLFIVQHFVLYRKQTTATKYAITATEMEETA